MPISQTCILFQHLIHFSFVFHIRIEYDVFVLSCWLPVLGKSQLSSQTHQILTALRHDYLKDVFMTQKVVTCYSSCNSIGMPRRRYAAFCILSKSKLAMLLEIPDYYFKTSYSTCINYPFPCTVYYSGGSCNYQI